MLKFWTHLRATVFINTHQVSNPISRCIMMKAVVLVPSFGFTNSCSRLKAFQGTWSPIFHLGAKAGIKTIDFGWDDARYGCMVKIAVIVAKRVRFSSAVSYLRTHSPL